MPRASRSVREDPSSRTVADSARRSPLAFALLVAALSLPFWLAGALTGWQPVEGLPSSSFMFLYPVAAAILTYRERGRAGVVALLKRAFDAGRMLVGLLVALTAALVTLVWAPGRRAREGPIPGGRGGRPEPGRA